MTVLAVALLVAAHAFDYVTFLVMTGRHGMAAELNPLVVGITQGFGLPGLTVAKLGSVVFLAAVVLLLAPRHRKGAALLLVIGVTAGVVGGFSNIAST
jgi:hypothetical protein